MKESKKIVFVGGGTLGHIYPLLPVAKVLKQKGYEIYFIGTKKGLEKELIEKTNLFTQTFYISMQGLKRSLSLKNIQTFILYIKAKKTIKDILQKYQIHLVIGMGGYISGVTLKVATRMNLKTILHEQNAVMGLSNRIVLDQVDRALLSFPIEEFSNNQHVKVIGNPRTSEIKNQYPIFYEDPKNILIVGGSRGSEKMNDIALLLSPIFQEKGYHVTLITGKTYYEKREDKIKQISSPTFTILPFTHQFISYLLKAWVVISRSGATTMSEIIALRKVAIFIPSPNVTKHHQEKNAQYMEQYQAAKVLQESHLTKQSLLEVLEPLMNQYQLHQKIKENISKLPFSSSLDLFVEEVEKYL